MTVSTFYPDSHPESTSVDGRAGIDNSSQSWSSIRGASSGNAGGTTDTNIYSDLQVWSSTTSNEWSYMRRIFVLFDTSTLGDSDSIDSATMELVVLSGGIIDNFTDSISMVTTNPVSATAIAVGDYSRILAVKQAADLTVAGLTADSSTYNAFTLNSTGRGNISLDGITKFGIRTTAENDDDEPSWVSDKGTKVTFLSADHSGSVKPKLVVTHTSPFTPKAMMF